MDKSKIGGILTIVSGGIGILISFLWLGMLLVMTFFITSSGDMGMPRSPGFGMYPANIMFTIWIVFYAIMILFVFLTSALAIVGGIFALRRKHWGVSLAGAIASIISFFPCGIAGTIFIIMGKEEF